jgi:hypothetical protein
VTLTILILLVGSLLIYGGWTNRNIVALIRGDNSVSK